MTQHIVVTISADTPIYVVFEKTPKSNDSAARGTATSARAGNSMNDGELRQLLQVQGELSQAAKSNQGEALKEQPIKVYQSDVHTRVVATSRQCQTRDSVQGRSSQLLDW